MLSLCHWSYADPGSVYGDALFWMLWVLAALTMTVGNVSQNATRHDTAGTRRGKAAGSVVLVHKSAQKEPRTALAFQIR